MLRLNKYIAMSGVTSRRKADDLIQDGCVKVNDKVVKELGTVINEKKDRVKVSDRKIKLQESKVYIMLNKPRGYVTTVKDEFDRKCVVDLIETTKRIFPIGRLDIDTEGLLLLTNDGDVYNQLMHPSSKCKKVYIAKVKGKVTKEKLEKLQGGVKIDEYITAKCDIKQIADDTLEITITEGKNRQVKKMCEAVELEVIKLKRTQIGTLELGDLRLGKYVFLTRKDIEKIR